MYLEGGKFLMGTDSDEGFAADGEGPVREVTLSPFWVDPFVVSNGDFARFVETTGYVTEAEKFGWSFVFHLFVTKMAHKRGEVRRVPGLEWWLGVDRACWKRPEGRGSDLRGRMDHPVVHVSYNDALAYCQWAGVRLLTEAEWEYAARGGLEQKRYVWGDELIPGGKHQTNIWQGDFPHRNTQDDGYAATAPVQSFEPNGYGLYNMAGNVWEWCADWFSPNWHKVETPQTRIDPRGPSTGERRVNRGGSYLCHASYCNRYRVAARSSNTPDSSTGNLGFRVGLSDSGVKKEGI
ncbi:MAG: formylglycine-generating enzyme family protein [Spirochaetales bacterium]|nr:formylglycine-generating enzyme family protein [Spirochaetales bacterium]